MTFKIAVCAGHGGKGSTPGKRTPNGEYEWNFNNKNVIAFTKEMNKYDGVEVKRFDDPTGKTDIPLKTRTDRANAWKADIYISFHHNANTGKWGSWTGVETYSWGSGESLRLAEYVHPKVVKAYGLVDRGIKRGSGLHIIKSTSCPAILIEGGFMDSVIDIKKLRNDKVLANAGIGVAKGVAEFAKLKLKEVPKPAPKPSNSNVYRVRKTWEDAKGQIGAFSKLENAIDLAKSKSGYKVFDSKGKQIYPEIKKVEPKTIYRVRKSWSDTKSQIGAFSELDNAKELADNRVKDGYKVFDEKGKVVYTPKAKEQTIIHIVEKGDTLWGISKKYNVSVEDIKKKNEIKNNVISIGQELVIKGNASPKPSEKKENTTDTKKEEVKSPEPQPKEKPQPKPQPEKSPKENPINNIDEHEGHHDIMGESLVIAEKMIAFVKFKNPNVEDIEEIAKQFISVGEKYGVRGDVAFCQSIIETGWFKFDGGTAVTPEQHNYCGLGVISKGVKGHEFETVKDGVTAQIQHLYAYSVNKPIPDGEFVIDPRFQYVKRGVAPHWEDLSNRWAMNDNYGNHILSIYKELKDFNYVPEEVEEDIPNIPEEPKEETSPVEESKTETPENTEDKQLNFWMKIIDYIFKKISELFKK